jgi:LDH2 family malate/lactate/ureidoglycolate dehydrogenase
MGTSIMSRKIASEELKSFAISILERVGASIDEAEIVADCLVKANLRGIDTHGIVLLPTYVKQVRNEAIKLGAKTQKVHETQSVALIDGGNGFGQVAGINAINTAIKKAKVYGVGVVSVFNANHFGMAAYYALKAIEHGMIGIVMCNVACSMPAWGGREAVLSNGPICFGFPAGNEPPIIVDMATSVKSKSACVMAARCGTKIPEGWALDENGRPTTNPHAALKGCLMPVGGIKGYCLAVAIEVLCGTLSGGLHSKNIRDWSSSYFMMALKIESFMSVKHFEDRINELIKIIKSSERCEGVKNIFLPGEKEFMEETKRLKEGIPIDQETWLHLTKLAEEFGVESPHLLEGEVHL